MHLSKKKILRFNDNSFMTKALRKAIMHRSKLKKVFHKTRTIVVIPRKTTVEN